MKEIFKKKYLFADLPEKMKVRQISADATNSG